MRIVIVLCVLALSSAATAEPIHDAEDDFTFTAPSSYRPIKLRPSGKPFYSFGRTESGKPVDGVLNMQAQDGVLEHAPLDRARYERRMRTEFAAARQIGFEYKTTRWKRWPLDVEIVHAQMENARWVVVGTQVPLAKRSWAIMLSGPEEAQASLLASLDALLASLDGKSNWK